MNRIRHETEDDAINVRKKFVFVYLAKKNCKFYKQNLDWFSCFICTIECQQYLNGCANGFRHHSARKCSQVEAQHMSIWCNPFSEKMYANVSSGERKCVFMCVDNENELNSINRTVQCSLLMYYSEPSFRWKCCKLYI